MTIETDLRDKVAHLAHGTLTGPDTIKDLPRTHLLTLTVPIDALATDVYGLFIHRFVDAVKIVSIKLVPSVAVTAADATRAVLTLTSENGAGAGVVAICDCNTGTTGGGNTGTGDWILGKVIDLSTGLAHGPFVPTAAAASLAAGRVLRLVQAKTGAGTIIGYTLNICYRLNG